jgi:hypothetical protein
MNEKIKPHQTWLLLSSPLGRFQIEERLWVS